MQPTLTGDLEAIRARVDALHTRPRALLLILPGTLEGSDPELLALAGGTPTAWADGPEVLILALRHGSLDDAEEYAIEMSESDEWWELPCVKEHDCYLLAEEFLAEGADRAEAARILATILHPGDFTDLLPPNSVRMFPEECYKKPEISRDDAA